MLPCWLPPYASVNLRTAVTISNPCFQKVAAAWTRSNLPPKELDAMFRGIEAVFKANRRLLSVSPLANVPLLLLTAN